MIDDKFSNQLRQHRLLVLENTSSAAVSAFGDRTWSSTELGENEANQCQWDWDDQALQISTGRLNMRVLFAGVSAGRAAISTSLLKVANAVGRLSLDYEAIAVFLRCGFFLSGDTPFNEIKAVPPAVQGSFPVSKLLEVSRERPLAWSSTEIRGPALECAYGELFRECVTQCSIVGELLHPLSGGRDSRHLLLELNYAGRHPVKCFTSELPPPRTLEDIRIARLLCERFRIQHEVIPLDFKFVESMKTKNYLTSLCADEHTWAIPLAKKIARHECTIYDGIGGDILSAGLFSSQVRLDRYRRAEWHDLANDILGDNEAFLTVALSSDFAKLVSREAALQRIQRELKRHQTAPNPVASFFFWNRTRREIAQYTFGLYPNSVRMHTPFLNPKLYDLLMGLPGEITVDKTLHTRTIHRMHPESADIPFGHSEISPLAARLPTGVARSWFRRTAFAASKLIVGSRCKFFSKPAVLSRLARFGIPGAHESCWIDIEKLVWLHQMGSLLNSSNEANRIDAKVGV